jgi:hypothetical protein
LGRAQNRNPHTTGEWQDITASVIARNKKSIATYEAILEAIRGKGSL